MKLHKPKISIIVDRTLKFEALRGRLSGPMGLIGEYGAVFSKIKKLKQ